MAEQSRSESYRFCVGQPDNPQGSMPITDGDLNGRVVVRNPETIIRIEYPYRVLRVQPDNWPQLPGRGRLNADVKVEEGKIVFTFRVTNFINDREDRFPDPEKVPFDLPVTVFYET